MGLAWLGLTWPGLAGEKFWKQRYIRFPRRRWGGGSGSGRLCGGVAGKIASLPTSGINFRLSLLTVLYITFHLITEMTLHLGKMPGDLYSPRTLSSHD